MLLAPEKPPADFMETWCREKKLGRGTCQSLRTLCVMGRDDIPSADDSGFQTCVGPFVNLQTGHDGGEKVDYAYINRYCGREQLRHDQCQSLFGHCVLGKEDQRHHDPFFRACLEDMGFPAP
ncbi:hypothetical protein GQ602_006381 [Ophiocordyceps camponoti-floridani]|uniref:Uncharacterized protein n=1 Tax=Ophiocordyceps camponoti-floridani TaxID=2030778 RepID=A0A8H4Q356_9HYPO|nr:hypothetical protein GQ602_006381 [Ophiocordyceps camponoti-floridani]